MAGSSPAAEHCRLSTQTRDHEAGGSLASLACPLGERLEPSTRCRPGPSQPAGVFLNCFGALGGQEQRENRDRENRRVQAQMLSEQIDEQRRRKVEEAHRLRQREEHDALRLEREQREIDEQYKREVQARNHPCGAPTSQSKFEKTFMSSLVRRRRKRPPPSEQQELLSRAVVPESSLPGSSPRTSGRCERLKRWRRRCTSGNVSARVSRPDKSQAISPRWHHSTRSSQPLVPWLSGGHPRDTACHAAADAAFDMHTALGQAQQDGDRDLAFNACTARILDAALIVRDRSSDSRDGVRNRAGGARRSRRDAEPSGSPSAAVASTNLASRDLSPDDVMLLEKEVPQQHRQHRRSRSQPQLARQDAQPGGSGLSDQELRERLGSLALLCKQLVRERAPTEAEVDRHCECSEAAREGLSARSDLTRGQGPVASCSPRVPRKRCSRASTSPLTPTSSPVRSSLRPGERARRCSQLIASPRTCVGPLLAPAERAVACKSPGRDGATSLDGVSEFLPLNCSEHRPEEDLPDALSELIALSAIGGSLSPSNPFVSQDDRGMALRRHSGQLSNAAVGATPIGIQASPSAQIVQQPRQAGMLHHLCQRRPRRGEAVLP